MAADHELTGKAKKAKRDEERRKAGKKRKRHQETQALPEMDDQPEADDEPISAAVIKDDVASQPKTKKRKHGADETKAVQTGDTESTSASKSKKRKRSTENTESQEPGSTTTAPAPAPKPKKQRFIVFVGNLPYTITTAGITEHFAKIKPESVRHMTEPDNPQRSKGYAFLEFADFDRMKTCLSLYHHTTIDSGVGGVKGVKKINVELTAGGGGTSANRQGKLKERNQRLQEQRQRKAEAVAKAEKRKGAKKGPAAAGDGAKGGPEKRTAEVKGEDAGIHPARLARINAG